MAETFWGQAAFRKWELENYICQFILVKIWPIIIVVAGGAVVVAVPPLSYNEFLFLFKFQISPGAVYYKTFYGRNLLARQFVISTQV